MILSKKSKNATKFVEIQKILNSKKNDFDFFFLNVIFLIKVDFFCFNCELILSDFRKINIKKYYLRNNEINVKTFHYFSIKNETHVKKWGHE